MSFSARVKFDRSMEARATACSANRTIPASSDLPVGSAPQISAVMTTRPALSRHGHSGVSFLMCSPAVATIKAGAGGDVIASEAIQCQEGSLDSFVACGSS
jgi:hypothetical protein